MGVDSYRTYLLQIPTQSERIITRFAPSPTGHLHLGHLISLLYVHAAAKRAEGTLILRLEDHDRQRCQIAFEKSIKEDVAWIGIKGEWQLQSNNQHAHLKALEKLKEAGLLYYCTCSRKSHHHKQSKKSLELHYDGHCRGQKIKPKEDFGIRLQIPDQTIDFEDLFCGHQNQHPSQQCGDLLVKDRVDNYTYNFAVVVDDMISGVNLVIRGADLLHCTGRQKILYSLLGQQQKITYGHHRLIYDSQGQKLSKKNRSKTILSQKKEGASPEKLIGEALWSIGALKKPRNVSLEESVSLLTVF